MGGGKRGENKCGRKLKKKGGSIVTRGIPESLTRNAPLLGGKLEGNKGGIWILFGGNGERKGGKDFASVQRKVGAKKVNPKKKKAQQEKAAFGTQRREHRKSSRIGTLRGKEWTKKQPP